MISQKWCNTCGFFAQKRKRAFSWPLHVYLIVYIDLSDEQPACRQVSCQSMTSQRCHLVVAEFSCWTAAKHQKLCEAWKLKFYEWTLKEEFFRNAVWPSTLCDQNLLDSQCVIITFYFMICIFLLTLFYSFLGELCFSLNCWFKMYNWYCFVIVFVLC